MRESLRGVLGGEGAGLSTASAVGERDTTEIMSEIRVEGSMVKEFESLLLARSEQDVVGRESEARLFDISCEWMEESVLGAGEMTPIACSRSITSQ